MIANFDFTFKYLAITYAGRKESLYFFFFYTVEFVQNIRMMIS